MKVLVVDRDEQVPWVVKSLASGVIVGRVGVIFIVSTTNHGQHSTITVNTMILGAAYHILAPVAKVFVKDFVNGKEGFVFIANAIVVADNVSDQGENDLVIFRASFEHLEETTTIGVFTERRLGSVDTDVHNCRQHSTLEGTLSTTKRILLLEVVMGGDSAAGSGILDIIDPILHCFFNALAPSQVLSCAIVRPQLVQNSSFERTRSMIDEGENAVDTSRGLGLVRGGAAMGASLLDTTRSKHHHDENARGENSDGQVKRKHCCEMLKLSFAR